MTADKSIKILLTMICLALWVIVLKPLFQGMPAEAQSHKRYEMEYYNLEDRGHPGARTAITNALRDKSKQGWRVVNMSVSGPSVGYYGELLILWEK